MDAIRSGIRYVQTGETDDLLRTVEDQFGAPVLRKMLIVLLSWLKEESQVHSGQPLTIDTSHIWGSQLLSLVKEGGLLSPYLTVTKSSISFGEGCDSKTKEQMLRTVAEEYRPPAFFSRKLPPSTIPQEGE